MKALALVLWLAAIALLACILRINGDATPVVDARPQTGRSLLAIAPAIPLLPQVSVVAVEEVAAVSACSRLGVFPRRDWAERVAAILEEAPASASVKTSAAVATSRVIDEVSVRPWRVRQVRPDAYYLQFNTWDVDELAMRMTMQRGLLKRLLSINAIPEAC